MKDNFFKVIRYIQIYGFSRTIVKAISNGNFNFVRSFYFSRKSNSVGLIGCGNFAFSTTCFFLKKNLGLIFGKCYDINTDRAKYLGKFFGFTIANSSIDIFNDKDIDYIYIASNHSSHSEYAIMALNSNKIPYIEKPIVVNYIQLVNLIKAKNNSKLPVYCGYNRPFSSAIQTLKQLVDKKNSSTFTISFIIVGHKIEDSHWYRKPEEGSRILANLSHWLDLSIYILGWKLNFPKMLNISISYSDKLTPSDNINIAITSDLNDLFVFTFTTRNEPLNGVNETILFQSDEFTAKIDDFRNMNITTTNKSKNYKFFPKDAGHENAILQPFNSKIVRDWKEIEISTLLILFIEQMVNVKDTFGIFEIEKSYSKLISETH